MSDNGVREIQLSGKHLVFLFMASVVVAVVVFLLGVSVGRGVRESTGTATAEATPADEAPPFTGELPPPTETTARDSMYQELLTGDTPQRGGATTAPAETQAGVTPEPAPEPEPVPDEAPATTAQSAEASTPAPSAEPPRASAEQRTTAPAAAPPPPTSRASQAPSAAAAAGGYSVQTNAYRSRASAEREVASLKQKGYAAYLDTASPSGLFRVRIGPFQQRDEADRVAARLRREGIQPLITR